MRIPRYYVDTSVIGGCYDEEFKVESRQLIDMAMNAHVQLLVSDLLVRELELAPLAVQSVLASLPESAVEFVTASKESIDLRDAYLAANVVGPSSAEDAHHVAMATIARAELIVSWNFKHIVHIDKIRGFQAVNLLRGYNTIDIRSPREVAL